VISNKCADGLWDYVSDYESTEAILARWSSAPLKLLPQLLVSLGTDENGSAEFAAFLGSLHGTNLGDRDACASLEGYAYFLASTRGSFSPAVGLCLPRQCQVDDVHALLAAVLPSQASNYKIRDDRFRFELDAVGVLVVVVTCLLGSLVFAATLLDTGVFDVADAAAETTTSRKKRDEPEAWWKSALSCFSLFRTYAAWTSRRGGALACLDGIRFLSMLWVIFGHSILWPLNGGPGFSNVTDIIPNENSKALMATWSGQLLGSAEFAVDTFFWLSGFLGAFFMLKVSAKAKSSTWIPFAVLQRYVRLTPAYAFVVFFWWKVERVFAKGALWSNERNQYAQCSQWWWANFLYVNNVVPFNNPGGCYGVAWYLPCDFQFFLLLPLFCVLHRYAGGSRSVYAATCSLSLASIAFSWELATREKLSFATFDASTYHRDYYLRPWTRAPAYLIGVATAVLWRDLHARWLLVNGAKTAPGGVVREEEEQSSNGDASYVTADEDPRQKDTTSITSILLREKYRWLRARGSGGSRVTRHASDGSTTVEREVKIFRRSEARLLLAASLVLAGCAVFGSWKFSQEVPSSPKLWKNHFYLVLSKPAWSVSLSLLTVLAFAGQAGYAGTFLELPVAAPLAKLTYCAYLIHPSVLDIVYKTLGAPVHYSVVWYALTFAGVSTIVMGLALVLHLALEAPFVSLEKLALRSGHSTKKTGTTDVVVVDNSNTEALLSPARRADRDLL